MPRGVWRFMEQQPPIDWAALVGQRTVVTRAGWKHRKKDTQKMRDVIRRRRKQKIKAATERAVKRQSEAKKAKRQPFVYGRILIAMQPGRWYSRRDVRERAGVSRDSSHGALSNLQAWGWVEKTFEPDRKPATQFQLTEAGESARERFLLLA